MADDKKEPDVTIPLWIYKDSVGVFNPSGMKEYIKKPLGLIFVDQHNQISVAFTEKMHNDVMGAKIGPGASIVEQQRAANVRLILKTMRSHLDAIEAVIAGKAESIVEEFIPRKDMN